MYRQRCLDMLSYLNGYWDRLSVTQPRPRPLSNVAIPTHKFDKRLCPLAFFWKARSFPKDFTDPPLW